MENKMMIPLATIEGDGHTGTLTLSYNRRGNTLDVLDSDGNELHKLAEGSKFANQRAAKDYIADSYRAKIWGLQWIG